MGDYDYNSYNGDWWINNNGNHSGSNFQNNNCNFYNNNDSYNNECYYNEFYDSSPQQNPYDYEQNQIHESPYFFDNPERSEESSYNEQWNQSQGYDNYYDYYNPPPQTNSSDMSLEDIVKNLAISTLSFKQETRAGIKNLEQVMQQLRDDLPENTQEDEITFLSNDEFVEKNACCHEESFDFSMQEPTSPNSEMVMEDYVSSDEEDFEIEIINQEKNEINLEAPQIIFYEPETPKVGEEFVEIQNNYQKSAIDVTCFGPTNDHQISDDLFVINTIDEHVNEHNANMLSNTAHDLENYFFCNRSKALDNMVKMKIFNKSRFKVFNRRKNSRLFTTWLKLHKRNELMPFDPGGIQPTYDPP